MRTVRITVPGRSVVSCERNEMIFAHVKTMSSVLESCRTSPSIVVFTFSVCGSGISAFVAMTGPSGVKVSKLLPKHHWPPPRSKEQISKARGCQYSCVHTIAL